MGEGEGVEAFCAPLLAPDADADVRDQVLTALYVYSERHNMRDVPRFVQSFFHGDHVRGRYGASALSFHRAHPRTSMTASAYYRAAAEIARLARSAGIKINVASIDFGYGPRTCYDVRRRLPIDMFDPSCITSDVRPDVRLTA
jgi:hypothetical protein